MLERRDRLSGLLALQVQLREQERDLRLEKRDLPFLSAVIQDQIAGAQTQVRVCERFILVDRLAKRRARSRNLALDRALTTQSKLLRSEYALSCSSSSS